MKTWRGRIWAARLSLLALALNALVPIHLAFDISEVFEAPQCSAHAETDNAEADNAERHLLALLIGHRHPNGKAEEHAKHHACPVCSALGALTGFVPPASTTLSAPSPADLPTAHFLVQTERLGALAAYRSRAPPLA